MTTFPVVFVRHTVRLAAFSVGGLPETPEIRGPREARLERGSGRGGPRDSVRHLQRVIAELIVIATPTSALLVVTSIHGTPASFASFSYPGNRRGAQVDIAQRRSNDDARPNMRDERPSAHSGNA